MPSPLPILTHRPAPSTADLLRLFHRTEAAWASFPNDPVALDVGTAYCDPEFPGVWDLNHVRDAALPPGVSPADAVAAVDAHFAARGCRCAYWVMSLTAPDGQTRPLIDHLLAAGHRAQTDDVLHLTRAPRASAPPAGSLKIIPARASYRHAERLARQRVAERYGENEELVRSALHDLDNSQFEPLLALTDGDVAGALGVLTVGDLGRIESVYVAPAYRRQGVARALMAAALDVCARAQFRHVFVQTARDNAAAKSLYAACGFDPLGEVTSYRAAWAQ